MSIATWSIKNNVFVWFLTVLILAGGINAYQNLGRLEDPEFAIKEALIVTQYPGASAIEVEEEVTEIIETAVQQLGQLKEIKSESKPGLSTITVIIKDSYDKDALPQVWDELRRKVSDAQSSLPPGVPTSVVMDDYGDVFGILMAVSGKDYSYKELSDIVDLFKREILLVKDVAKVTLWGDQPEKIFVEISRSKIANMGVSLEDIYVTLATQNLVKASGLVKVANTVNKREAPMIMPDPKPIKKSNTMITIASA